MEQAMKTEGAMLNAEEQKMEQTRQLNTYIAKLIGGQVPPPNKYVASLVKQIRAAQADTDALRNNIEAIEVDLQRMKERRLILGGVIQNLAQNVAEWRDHVDPPTDPQPKEETDGSAEPPKPGPGVKAKPKGNGAEKPANP